MSSKKRFPVDGLRLSALAKWLGVSIWTARRRVIEAGVPYDGGRARGRPIRVPLASIEQMSCWPSMLTAARYGGASPWWLHEKE